MNPFVRRVLLGVGLATAFATVALGTSGCGLTPVPHSTAVAADTPATPPATPEPAAASGSQPEPAADVTCNDLTNPAQVAPLFAEPVNLAPPTRTFEYVGAAIAQEWIVRQAGGVACQWSDPEGISTSEGRFLAGIDLRLLPASGPQWQAFSDAEGDGSNVRFVCSEYGSCQYDRYTATGWWLTLDAFDIDALASPTEASLRTLSEPIFGAIASTAEALPAPDPAWTAPTPELSFGGGCTGAITGDRLAAALGVGGTFSSEIGNSAALDLVGGSDCRWTQGDSFTGPLVYIQVLPGGAWAQQAAKAAMEANGAPVPSPAVAGVPAGDTALYHHVDSTALDIVLGGTWIKIALGNGPEIAGHPIEDSLIAIATDIAAHAH